MDDNDNEWIFWLISALLVLWFGWFDDSELRYKMKYGGEVTYYDTPHDCEFLTAPLGRKNCSYYREVEIIQYSQDKESGDPIISYDEGKTWQWNPGGATNGRKVEVRWGKTND